MLVLLSIILQGFLPNPCKSQEFEFQIYNWEELQSANPDTIYGISFAKDKISELPVELANFKNLRYLNLNRNKFSSLPDFLDSLKNLEVIEASRNSFKIFPLVLTRLSKIRELNFYRNDIEVIPDLIKNNTKLEKLDLSDNSISTVPEGLFSIENLKTVNFTGVRFGPRYQDFLRNQRKDITWILDPPCDCME
jgi:Leucine-rich repeat (LRR) protein